MPRENSRSTTFAYFGTRRGRALRWSGRAVPSAARGRGKRPNFLLEPRILRRYFDPLGIPLEDPLFSHSSFRSKTSIVKKKSDYRERSPPIFLSSPSRRSFFHRTTRLLVLIYPSRTYGSRFIEMHDVEILLRRIITSSPRLFTSTRNEARCQERHYSKQSVNDV